MSEQFDFQKYYATLSKRLKPNTFELHGTRGSDYVGGTDGLGDSGAEGDSGDSDGFGDFGDDSDAGNQDDKSGRGPDGPKFQRLRKYVQGLSNGALKALYVCGPPGTLKMTTIESELEELGETYKIICPPLSPDGFYRVLREHREQIVVVKSSSLLYENPDLVQLVLRSIQHGDQYNTVIRSVSGYQHQFEYNGKLLFISDRLIADDPMAQLFFGDDFLIEHELTNDEIQECLDAWVEQATDVLTEPERKFIRGMLKFSMMFDGVHVNLNHLNQLVTMTKLCPFDEDSLAWTELYCQLRDSAAW